MKLTSALILVSNFTWQILNGYFRLGEAGLTKAEGGRKTSQCYTVSKSDDNLSSTRRHH